MKKLLVVFPALVIVLLVSVVVVRLTPSAAARKAWKDKQIAELSSLMANPTWVSNTVAQLKQANNGDEDSGWWISDRLILLQSGEWLAYAAICQKQDRRISDLFLACGSDGQWYSSTYHFCRGMIVLRMDGQPADLPAFINSYYLRPFDGISEDCLQTTWPSKKESSNH